MEKPELMRASFLLGLLWSLCHDHTYLNAKELATIRRLTRQLAETIGLDDLAVEEESEEVVA